ncbi:MAG TPA: ABC transporter substrate-binding protein [Candidatus Butyricicoccus avicola]|nr:ABC transporter substrate-binding protein [Candidatus Butyricicoccus avicola]
MNFRRILAAGLAAGLLALTGCGAQEQDSATDANAADDGALTTVNVVLDWYPNAIHAFLYNAIENGYFADEGLDVQLQFPSNENDALSLVAAGQSQIGIYYPMYVIEARANQDVPVKSIGAVCQEQLSVVVSLADQNITSPADFAGKNIGYGGAPLTEALAKTMMEYVGVDPDSVTMTNVGMDLMSSMTTGRVNATLGCMLNHEVPQLEEEGFAVNYFHMSDYGVPADYELVFVSNDETIESDPEMLQGFLRACEKGFADMKNDPEGSLDLLLSRQNAENFPLTRSVEEQSMQVLLPAMEHSDAPFLSQAAEVWQNDIDWMAENGMIEAGSVTVDDVMVDLDA